VNRCTFFDEAHGCGLNLVEGIPSQSDCDSCSEYAGPSRGLGDKVYKITKAVGIEKVKRKLKSNCGCQKRRETLNRKFPTKDS